MIASFELSWLGGAAERHARRRRSGIDDLPWGTLEPTDYPPELVERARLSWTQGAFNEYCTAAAFAELTGALLAANAPIDLVAMAGDFVADEMVHVELNARVAMELGGGAPVSVDFGALTPTPRRGLSPIQRASELCVRTCCVGEAFSVPMLVGTLRAAAHPLTRAVLQRIVKDESPHARLGWLYLGWIAEGLDARERRRLGRIAESSLAEYAPYWRSISSTAIDGITSEGFQLAHVHELGWMEAQAYAAGARHAVRTEIVEPLARFGIPVRAAVVEELLGN